MSITRSQIARQLYARGGNTGYSDFASPSSSTASQDFATQAVSGGQTDYGGGGGGEDSFNKNLNRINTGLRSAGAVNNVKNAIASKGLLSFPAALAMSELYHLLNSNKNQTAINNLELLKSGLAQGGRVNYANGGRMSETAASYSSPTARAADDRFSPASDSGSGGDNQPIVARPDYVVTDSVPNYPRQGIFSKLINQLSPYGAAYAGTVLGGPFGGKKFFDIAKEEAEKRQQAEDLVPNAMLSGSQVFSIPGSFQQAYNKQYGIPNTPVTPPTFTGGDNQIIPRMQMIAEAPSDVDGTLSDFDLYMQNLRTAQPNPFMLDPRFAAAQGGVARQAYGLGSLVRKATKAVKKVLKSDVGKAALLYGAGTYLGGTKAFSGGGDLSFMDRLRDPALLKNLVYTDGKFSPFKGITAATALTSLLSKDEEEDEDLDQISSREDKSGLREQMATYKPFRFELQSPYRLAANGGRIGYEEGGNINPADLPMSREGLPTYEDIETGEEVDYPYKNKERSSAPDIDAELFQMYLDAIGSGKIPRSTTFDQYKELMGETASMGPERTMANEGGLMSLGGNEMDLRGGGFVPLGAREKADDVPARLSKNEFVFTADAVKAAGGGDVDRGANLMYKTMKNLESRVG
jgi:hypothetical protein